MINKVALVSNYSSIAFVYILVFILLIALYLLSRKLIQINKLTKKFSKNIEIVEKFYLSADKALLIVKVSDEYLLLSSDKTGTSLIKELKDFVPNEKEDSKKDFQSFLKNAVKKGTSDEI